ncbi:hypothetical protein GQR58_009126 [Nymphon striatum]|nr:hypothetical protein GQR58_009126 [Nymphon striatum]
MAGINTVSLLKIIDSNVVTVCSDVIAMVTDLILKQLLVLLCKMEELDFRTLKLSHMCRTMQSTTVAFLPKSYNLNCYIEQKQYDDQKKSLMVIVKHFLLAEGIHGKYMKDMYSFQFVRLSEKSFCFPILLTTYGEFLLLSMLPHSNIAMRSKPALKQNVEWHASKLLNNIQNTKENRCSAKSLEDVEICGKQISSLYLQDSTNRSERVRMAFVVSDTLTNGDTAISNSKNQTECKQLKNIILAKRNDPEFEHHYNVVMQEMYLEKPNLKLDDVCGLEDAKKILKEAIVYPIEVSADVRKELFPVAPNRLGHWLVLYTETSSWEYHINNQDNWYDLKPL